MTVVATDPWAIDVADEVLPYDAPRGQWLDARRRGIGGSDVSALVNLSPYATRVSLWLDKTGRWVDDTDSDAAEWGRRLEPVVADWFTDTTGIATRRAGLMRSREHPVAQVSVDRLCPHSGLEVKTLDWRFAHLWADGQTPDHAELQAQWCMAVTGRASWWVVGLESGRRPHLRMIERDPDLIAMLLAEAEEFWAAFVVADEMPALDNTTATAEAIRGWVGAADPGRVVAVTPELLDLYAELAAAKDKKRLAEAAVTGIDTRIRLLLGDAAVVALDPDLPVDDSKAGRDNVLLTIRNDGQFSPAVFGERYPELVAGYTRPTPVLDAAAIKVDHPDEHRACRSRQIRPRKKNLAAALAARTAARAIPAARTPGST